MPNVPETPNFEAIIQLLSITNSEAGFQLQAPVNISAKYDDSIALAKDAGIPQGLIQVSEYDLIGDTGIPQGLVNVSEFGLTEQDIRNPLSELLSIVDNIDVSVSESDLALTFDDVRILISDIPENLIPSGIPVVIIKNQQTLLFNFIQTCNYGGCKPTNRTTIKPDRMLCTASDCKD